jgi:hypothetical protein
LSTRIKNLKYIPFFSSRRNVDLQVATAQNPDLEVGSLGGQGLNLAILMLNETILLISCGPCGLLGPVADKEANANANAGKIARERWELKE